MTETQAHDITPILDRARARLDAGRLDDAQDDCMRALRRSPGDPRALHMWGRVRLARGEHEAGARLLERAVAERPDDVALHRDLAAAYRALQDAEKALDHLHQAIKLDTHDVDAYLDLVSLHAAMGNLNEAGRVCLRAIDVAPDSAEAHAVMAAILFKTDQLDSARQYCDAALQRGPKTPPGWRQLASVLDDLGRKDEAQACLARAQAMDKAEEDRQAFARLPGGIRLSRSLAALKPAGTIARLGSADAPKTYDGNGGINVVRIGGGELADGQSFLLRGGPEDQFVINMHGDFHLAAGASLRGEGIEPRQILWNFVAAIPGEGDEAGEAEPDLVTASGASIFGNVLALRNDMDFQATVEGALITAKPLPAPEGEESDEARPIATTPAEIARAAAEAEDEAETDASSLVDVLRILQPDGVEPQEESLAEMVAGLNVSISGKGAAAGEEVPRGPVGPQPVAKGQAATVWVWKSRLGQKLLRRLNGSADSTLLADWLGGSFPRIYGAEAGGSPLDDKHPGNNLSGLANTDLCNYFKALYKRSKRTAVGGGPPRLEAQLLATALSAYVTTEDCVGRRFGAEEAYAEDTDVILVNEIRGYGFDVSSEGVGGATFALGEHAHVLGFEDADEPTVMQILQATDRRARYGLLFDLDEDGDARDEEETQARTAANGLFEAINEKGEF